MKRILALLFTFLNKRLRFRAVSTQTQDLLKSSIKIFDIGASGAPQEELLSIAHISDITICEPDKRIQEITKKSFFSAGFSNVQFIENFLGNGTLSSFYLTKRQECSSLLKPNSKINFFFPLKERFENESILKVQTSTLSSLKLNHSFDFLKIDTQGSELEILKNFNKISDLLLLESEVEFLELYAGQPLQRDMDIFLSEHNFSMIDLKCSKWKLNNASRSQKDLLVHYAGRNVLSFGNALYINNLYLPWNLRPGTVSKEGIVKIAILLSRFKQISLAVSILEKSFSLEIINLLEFETIKEECMNFKLKKILLLLLPKKTILNSFEFDREFL